MKKQTERFRSLTKRWVLACLGVTLLAAGCSRPEPAKTDAAQAPTKSQTVVAEGTPVRVTTAVRTNVRRTVAVTGSIAALQTADLSPKIAGKVTAIAGREGAPVRKGQVIVQQETIDLANGVQQAQANLEAAQARLAQTRTQVQVQVSTSSGAISEAEEQLRFAQAQLELARRPQRSEEVALAQNALSQAQANYDKAVADRARYAQLVQAGAAPQSVLDQYTLQEQVDRAGLDSAKQQLAIAQTGGRNESVRAAQANVERARWGVRQARTNVLQNDVRRKEVAAAEAAVAQFRAALQFAQQQVANASIRAPFDGVISERMTEPGQQATPGAPVVKLVALNTVVFEAQVSETDIAALRTNLPVEVRVDALKNRTFAGRVAKVYPTASTASRNFTVRVVLANPANLLRPGLFARGDVVVENRTGTVVAKDALLSRNGKNQMFVAQGTRADLRTIRVGVQTPETVEVREGIRAGERVIVVGQDGLADGDVIRVQSQPETSRTASVRR